MASLFLMMFFHAQTYVTYSEKRMEKLHLMKLHFAVQPVNGESVVRREVVNHISPMEKKNVEKKGKDGVENRQVRMEFQ